LLTGVTAILMAVTGMLVTHSGRFGLGVEGPPEQHGTGDLTAVTEINDLLKAALREAVDRDIRLVNRIGRSRPASGPSAIDRAVFRPETRTVQVRLRDARTTEMVLDWSTGTILNVTPRLDMRLRHVHAATILSTHGVVISDVMAAILLILALTGIVLWIAATREKGRRLGPPTRWWSFNWWFHRVGGLIVSVYLSVICVSGIMLNHKHELGLMVEPARQLEAEYVARQTPMRVHMMIRTAVQAIAKQDPSLTSHDVAVVDYRPLRGYGKVRFKKDDLEVVVNAYDAEILSIARRRDLFIEKLHTGAALGEYGFLVSDLTGILLILLTVNGLYLWVKPSWIGRGRQESEGVGT
jgi:uncharacterized iron-regulated membrane protein